MSSSRPAAKRQRYAKPFLTHIKSSPNWYIQATIIGDDGQPLAHPFRRSTKTTEREEADNQLAEFILENRTRSLETNQGSGEITIGDLFDHYRDKHLVPEYLKEGWTPEQSENKARNRCKVALEYFGVMTVADLEESNEPIEKFIASERERGQKYSSIQGSLTMLRAALRFAHNCKPRILRHHPPAIPQISDELIASTEDVPQVFTRDQLRESLAILKGRKTVWRACVIMIGTGCRPEAAIELTPAQCDFERGLINLNPPGRVQEPHKWRATVRMPDALKALLKEWIKEDDLKPNQCFVALSAYSEIGADFREKLRGDNGILSGKYIPYSLRHTVEAEMEAADLPEVEIQVQLGHRRGYINDDTTRRYGRAVKREYRQIGRAHV